MTDPNTNVNPTDATDEIKPEATVEGTEETNDEEVKTTDEEVKTNDDSAEETKTDEEVAA